MVNEVLGANIRKKRLERNWTQEKLAEVLCISHQMISKWENGFATPDVATLCAMTRIFDISLDALCGIAPEQADELIGKIESAIPKGETTFQALYEKWMEIKQWITADPTNDKLLFATLKFLRAMHDAIESDAQKDMVNEETLLISERLLDFSRNDEYRSLANFCLAIYYQEHVQVERGNAQDMANARKAGMYADLVLYKDMPHVFYHGFGAVSLQDRVAAMEKTLLEIVNATTGACRNLLRCYNRDGQKGEAYEQVTALGKEMEDVLNRLSALFA